MNAMAHIASDATPQPNSHRVVVFAIVDVTEGQQDLAGSRRISAATGKRCRRAM